MVCFSRDFQRRKTGEMKSAGELRMIFFVGSDNLRQICVTQYYYARLSSKRM